MDKQKILQSLLQTKLIASDGQRKISNDIDRFIRDDFEGEETGEMTDEIIEEIQEHIRTFVAMADLLRYRQEI